MIIRWKAVSMEHFTGEFNSHKTDVKLMPDGWHIFVDDKQMRIANKVKLDPFKTAKKAQDFAEATAQKVIRNLARQSVLAQQHTTLLPQAA